MEATMRRISILLWILFTCFSVFAWTQVQVQTRPNRLHQYTLYDLGTFGGPNSSTSFFAPSLSIRGAIGGAQTATHDPFDPICLGDPYFSGCFVMHGFQWNNGVLTDLVALGKKGNSNSSFAAAINNFGLVAGYSEDGSTDSSTGYPVTHAVIWRNGKIKDLGTFGGTQSSAMALNDLGQVVGGAFNKIDDPLSTGFALGFGVLWPGTTQIRAFVWQNGVMRDLGTLGGPDAFAYAINRFGQIAGQSYTSSTPNDTTGIPTVDPFLWTHGKMRDLGSLGGTIGFPVWLNDWGQVAGFSNLAGDAVYHGFLWSHGKINDLPPASGGNYSWALWINDLGDVTGGSTLSGDSLNHASLWSYGRAIDLGTVGQDLCSEAWSINDFRQVVGLSNSCSGETSGRAFIWQNGGPMLDLNALLENPSDLYLYGASYITDRGEIIAQGMLSNGEVHTALLVPSGDCEQACQQRIAESQKAAMAQPRFAKPDWLRKRLSKNHAVPGNR
jgi:probable HAF family extracellular repeat protein